MIYFCIVLFSRSAGDTIDRLSTLHELLAEAADWPRVVRCAQIVPVMLHVFFNAVIKVRRTFLTEQHAQPRPVNNCDLSQVADEQLLAHLILVILERSSLLLNIPSYSKEIHRFSHLPVGRPRWSAALQTSVSSLSPPLRASVGSSAATC